MGSMMQYVLSEKKVNYENSCFFLSIFGLGPAWTMYGSSFPLLILPFRILTFCCRYIFGFFLPFLWFFGLFYIASAVSVKKTAGYAHCATLILYVVYHSFSVRFWTCLWLRKIHWHDSWVASVIRVKSKTTCSWSSGASGHFDSDNLFHLLEAKTQRA